ncbi:VPLPA-CTERM sorting domain-containing protein [Thiohalobacter sp. IOR34]|uniref:VPLPA-CTERM sorting domain-containing protein n=1 Tax=Thiohalobacter sp. IOR34 TaxID=3057176 RepID=UPI0025B167B7|nr:VPLPA-CTERM sorting domain-containing protein [Thiohalobacter sp. IOR34]WJW75281.1 VPLPA-CTERM sorting domain-containing protein [Thiohalobacter sp. IOR34]
MPIYRTLPTAALLLGSSLIAQTAGAAGVVQAVPFNWEPSAALTWVDADDDSSSGETPLGFSVTLGGTSFSRFDMDSNGYIQLLTDTGSASGSGYGSIDDLILDDSSATYILAAYDDLDSYYYGYYGYTLFSDRAVFNYTTETFGDGGSGRLNIFQVVLHDDGRVNWNFMASGYQYYEYDLFTGLYLADTNELVEVIRNDIPSLSSYSYTPSAVPVPAAVWLFGSGLVGLVAVARRRG